MASNGPNEDIDLKKGVQEPTLNDKSAIQQKISGITQSGGSGWLPSHVQMYQKHIQGDRKCVDLHFYMN